MREGSLRRYSPRNTHCGNGLMKLVVPSVKDVLGEEINDTEIN